MTEPIFVTEDGNTRLYHDDANTVLANMESESIDLVVSDPPYGIKYDTGFRVSTDPLVGGIANDTNLGAIAGVIPDLYRVMKNNTHIYLFMSPYKIGELYDLMADWWDVKNILVWDKGEAGAGGDLACGYSPSWEAILYAMKGKKELIGRRDRTVLRFDWQGIKDPVHPTVKPVSILKYLIMKSSQEGDIVLDPFAGSATTLRAAMNLKRKSIGVELDQQWIGAAVDRLRQGVLI
jgi:DNA modification methylase